MVHKKREKFARYEIKTNTNSKWFELFIFDNAKELEKYLDKIQPGLCHNCLGQVTPTPYISREDGEYYCSKFATMFLSEGNLGVGIIAHECLHLALAYERYVLGFRGDYGNDCNDDEERLAYKLTEFVRMVYEIIYAHGHAKER